jgi:hypothetical protein
MTQTDNNRLPYAAPCCDVIEIETAQMLANSVTGYVPDSDDTEFGEASERRGVWGNFWE